jgi:hypothetical protein
MNVTITSLRRIISGYDDARLAVRRHTRARRRLVMRRTVGIVGAGGTEAAVQRPRGEYHVDRIQLQHAHADVANLGDGVQHEQLGGGLRESGQQDRPAGRGKSATE